jgi:hypothetical protein
MKSYLSLGVQIPQILIPEPGLDLTKWAVIACDQFTSQPEYWMQVEKLIGIAPSTYNLILPEVMLGTPAETARIDNTRQTMLSYLQKDLLTFFEGMVLVERGLNGKSRHGLMLALDLEMYDFKPGSQSLIRSTEGTILERLPPRIRIRQGAALELPHILVLIDDPGQTVIEPLVRQSTQLTPLYDFELMKDSGHLKGWLVSDAKLEAQVIQSLEKLASPVNFYSRYNVPADKGVLLFAVGDGNHSLATAKSIWEKMKSSVSPDHPARYALVEVENVHDAGVAFEPIHRVLFEVNQDFLAAFKRFFGNWFHFSKVKGQAEMVQMVTNQKGPDHAFGVISPEGFGIGVVNQPASNLPVGTLQPFLDDWLGRGGCGRIDYVHGADIVCHLGAQKGNLGFYLPTMPKEALFKTVIMDGVLPRKAFSMGEAKEKRFYMEARQIK